MRARLLLTDRWGGVSGPPYDAWNLGSHVGDDPEAVAANRRLLADRAGLAPEDLRFMDQVHGRTVGEADATPPARAPEVDGLITTTPGVGLAVLVADCVPVLFEGRDAAGRTIGVAVAHAGRRGLQLGVVTAALDALVGRGAVAEQSRALVGPAVCGACYEVPAAMADEVAVDVPAARAVSAIGTPALDVRAGVVAQLRAAGVGGIEVDPRCTRESPELYSYRRDGVTGRFAGLARLVP